MPRGKNYMNNNQGVALQNHKKKSASMEPCYYGAVCTRKDCIYRHDVEVPDNKKSHEVCLSFLAGTCNFTASTCKKRHPNKQESERLRAKYSTIKCRFADDCKTKNCLYTHPRDEKPKEEPVAFLEQGAFPPLAGDKSAEEGGRGGGQTTTTTTGGGAKLPARIPASAWKAAPVVTSSSSSSSSQTKQENKQQQQPTLSKQQTLAPQLQPKESTTSTHISADAPAWFPGNPHEDYQNTNGHGPSHVDDAVSSSPPSATTTDASSSSSAPPIRKTIPCGKSLSASAKEWVPGVGIH